MSGWNAILLVWCKTKEILNAVCVLGGERECEKTSASLLDPKGREGTQYGWSNIGLWLNMAYMQYDCVLDSDQEMKLSNWWKVNAGRN